MLVVGVVGEGEIVVGHGEEAEAEGEGEDSDCCFVYVGRSQLSILCFKPYVLVHYLLISNRNGQLNGCRVSSACLTCSLYRTSGLLAKSFRCDCSLLSECTFYT